MAERRVKVLVAKVGLDGHDRGIRVVARALRDAGMEVIYAGLRQTPEMVADAALQEDVDAVGISTHNAAHLTLIPRILRLLRERGLGHVLVTGGGIVPAEDIAALRAMGCGELFPPGAPLDAVCAYVRDEVQRRRAEAGRGGAAAPGGPGG
jgi:methylmalonyl-CoA mutase C-terminal domain/subunit